MAVSDLVPVYYFNQDYRSQPLYHETRGNIKLFRKSGKLNGGYQHNGSIFVLFTRVPSPETRAIADFRDAWRIRPSGGVGPLVWQYRT